MSGHLLLTGGAGFIGSALARALADAGWRVVVLDKLTYAGRRENLIGVDCELVVGDVCDPGVVRSLVQGADVVVHAAAESHVTRSLDDPAPFLRTNIEGTRVVLEAAAEARVPHTVHISTDEVFGACPEPHAFGPHDPLRPGNPYAASKAAAEAFVHAVAHTRGYRATIVRCTNNYGPRQHIEKAIPTWAAAARSGRPLLIHGSGLQVRDWLHVDDFARGILRLLDRGRPGEIHHFSGGNSQRNLDVARLIVRLAGSESELRHVPDRPGQDLRYALDDRATRSRLEWSPEVDWTEGLAETLRWYAVHEAA